MSMVAIKAPYTLILWDDDMAESPRETDDCFGTMVCWHRRYDLGDKHNYTKPKEFLTELIESIKDMNDIAILPLYLYDHSGITMNTTGFSCPWDSGQVGWVYADKDKILSEFGVDQLTPEIMENAKNLLRGEVSYYDHYIRGDCYGFQLYRDDKEIDSCWGFIGDTDDLRDAIECHLPDECKGMMNDLTYRSDDPHIETILREHEGDFGIEP